MPAPDLDDLVLHDFARSSAATRVRIALNLKGLAWQAVPHDLLAGEQRATDYLARNPQGLVPALEVGGTTLTQSLAIIEWLEETHPQPPLLPKDPIARAQVRAMALVIACEIHPLQNLGPGNRLRDQFAADNAAVVEWNRHWITRGFDALEPLVACHGDRYAYGDSPGLADCCLVPQANNADRFRLPLHAWPHLSRVIANARAHPAFAAAQPPAAP